MTTSTPVITDDTLLLSHQLITHPDSKYGAPLDVETKWWALIDMSAGFIEAAANTNPGKFIIQTSARSSGDEDWIDAYTAEIPETGTPADEALTNTETLGTKVLRVAATTGFAALNDIYILDASVLADSEWAKVETIVAATSIDITDGLTTGKDSADTIFGSAFRDSIGLDLRSVSRIRAIFMHEGVAGANMHVKVQISTFDSVLNV
jgi:hypothetical protein